MQFRTFTLTILFALLWCSASAQVTLTAETNSPPAGYTDSIYISLGGGLLAPEGGANLTWDYSSLPASTLRVVELSDETSNSDYPEAIYGSPGVVRFQIFEADAVIYVGSDTEGTHDIGRVITESIFPLTAITGNPDDTFTFVGDTVTYEGRVNDLQFPMTYPDAFSATRIERTNIALSVAAFGLSNTPVQAKRAFTQDREVIGYGKIIIPQEDHSASPPIDVLLMRVEQTVSDSFFLAGNLPPQALLDAFGVSQGMTSTSHYFVFYTPDLSSPVADVSVNNDGTIFDVFFRPRAADLVLATQNFTAAQFSLSPNPLRAGQQLFFQTDQDLQQGQVRLLHLNGQLAASIPLQNAGTGQYNLTIPSHLAAGMYLMQAFDQTGRLFRAEKVVVN